MSKTTKYLIGACTILALLFVLTSYKTCQLYDKNSILKGKDKVLSSQLEEETKKRKVRERDIKMLIGKLEEERRAKTSIIEAAKEITGAMRNELRTVGELRANAENDKALITEMVLEIGKRDELIDKLVFTIKTQEERYFTLTQQYNVVIKELGLSNMAIESRDEIIVVKDHRIKGLEKSLKGVRFSSGIKTPIILGLAAAVIYGLVK